MPQHTFIKGMYFCGSVCSSKKLNFLHSSKMDFFWSLRKGTVVDSVSVN